MKFAMKDLEDAFNSVIREEMSFEEASEWAAIRMEKNEQRELQLQPGEDVSEMFTGLAYLSGIDIRDESGKYIHSIKNVIDEFNKLYGETYYITDGSRICKIGKLELTMKDLEEMFTKVIREEISFEEASDWAAVRMEKDKYDELELQPGEDVSEVFDGLTYLAGVDLKVAPGEYLHDIKNVKDEYQKLFGKNVLGRFCITA